MFLECCIDRSPARIAFGKAGADPVTGGEQSRSQCTEGLGQYGFETEAKVLGQASRRSARTYRHQYRIAVKHAGQGKIAKVGLVGDIHQQTGLLKPAGRALGSPLVLQRNEGKLRMMRFGFSAWNAARPFD